MQPRVPEIYPHTLWPDTYRNTRFIEAISHTPDVLENAFDEVPPRIASETRFFTDSSSF